ncbi:treZ [Symbiodinium sp. KB8]|nr:treZ [Symbiodinium sp. KB8]
MEIRGAYRNPKRPAVRVYHLDLWAGTIRVDCEATGEGHSGTNGIRRVIRDMTGADKEPSPDLDVLNDFYEFRPSNLVDDLRKLINNPAFADVTFVVENQSVYATRAHLAARSEHFRALFYGGMRESSDAEEQIVLQDVAHPVFLLLLEYIYTDQVLLALGKPSSAGQLPSMAGGSRVFEYWDPTATNVWLVCKHDEQCYPMQKGLEPGHWVLHSSDIPTGAPYAFVSEWVQELRHCGERSWFGSVHPEAQEVGLVPKDLPSPEMLTPQKLRRVKTPASSDSEKGGYSTGDEATTDEAATPPGEPTDAERLAASEFFVQATDNPYVTDGHGVRLRLLVAPRVAITGAQAAAADGSWGPLTLRKMPQASPPAVLQTAEDEEEAEDPLAPGQWIGDAINFCIHGDTEILLRVHRRDWRVDPNAFGLQREDGDGWYGTLDESSPKMEGTAFAPLGPAYWSIVTELPPTPEQFARCSDRELVLYELHLGSFTSEGTLVAAAAKLPHLRDLGITAISLMPVQQDVRRLTSGELDRWGYDVISFAAVDASYGGLQDLAHFVQQAHMLDLAVIVDFVFNHMMWGAQFLYGPHLFLPEETIWGPRPDFSKPEAPPRIPTPPPQTPPRFSAALSFEIADLIPTAPSLAVPTAPSASETPGTEGLSTELIDRHRLLECSRKHIIRSGDWLSPMQCMRYKPRRPCEHVDASGQPAYPLEAPWWCEDPRFFEVATAKAQIQMLFSIFYYQPNTYRQYLASEELKRNTWRYHCKYQAWFQRQDVPRIVTPRFERGSFYFFDFESLQVKTRDDFTFEYAWLEGTG